MKKITTNFQVKYIFNNTEMFKHDEKIHMTNLFFYVYWKINDMLKSNFNAYLQSKPNS